MLFQGLKGILTQRVEICYLRELLRKANDKPWKAPGMQKAFNKCSLLSSEF